VWLSVVNTALAFYLRNQVLRFLRAYELSILQNSMLVQIAILSFIFLGESVTWAMMAGMILVLVGIVLVQVTSVRKRR
jgi:drug/metabolite transporter (DMT)-like permease